jgi:hypothetical protein
MLTVPAASLPPGPTEGCALIVGLEQYRDAHWPDLPGAAADAARFAAWLVKGEICVPGRIELVTSAPDAVYHGEAFKKLAAEGIGISPRPQRDARADFADWIAGPRGPLPGDRFFYLFWAGHGVVYPNPNDPRICLVTAEADGAEIAHLELLDLLAEVGKIAPAAHQVGFVGTCREEVAADRADALHRGQRSVSAPRDKILAPVYPDDYPGTETEPAQRSIAFAASPGQSAWAAGYPGQTFPRYILQGLDALPAGSRPERLFESFLGEFEASLDSGADADAANPVPAVLEYRRIHAQATRLWASRRSFAAADLTREEWTTLHDIAERIDAAPPATVPALADRCWAAYCHAVGLQAALRVTGAGVARAVEIGGARDLVRELLAWPAADRLPPPFLLGCDFLANWTSPAPPSALPGSPAPALSASPLPVSPPRGESARFPPSAQAGPALPELARWCTEWGGNDTPGWRRKTRLDTAEVDRLRELPGEEYLSVMLDGAQFDATGQLSSCMIKGDLSAIGGRAVVLSARKVAGPEVIDTVLRLINSLDTARIVRDFDELALEFALPRPLLARRLEYEGPAWAGKEHPVVIRDVETFREQRVLARRRQRKRLAAITEGMKALPPGAPWAGRVKWLGCKRHGALDRDALGLLAQDPQFFIIAVTHDYRQQDTSKEEWAASDMMAHSIDGGAPIVMSVHTECGRCQLKSQGFAPRSLRYYPCLATRYQPLIERVIDASGQAHVGPDCIPGILRSIRNEAGSAGLRLGVVMYADRDAGNYGPLKSAADRSEN